MGHLTILRSASEHANLSGLARESRLAIDLAQRGRALPFPNSPQERRFRLRLLGDFELEDAHRAMPLSAVGQRLVAYMAIEQRPIHRSHIAGVFWPDTSEARATGNLRTQLWRLRQQDCPLIEATNGYLSLSADIAIDVRDLTTMARRALESGGEPDMRLAEALVRADDVLVDWSEDWVAVERERFRQLRLHTLERLCGQLARKGEYGQAIELCLRAVSTEPLRESAQRQLIQVYLAEGNAVDALRQFRAYETLLTDELGLEPSAAMVALLHGLNARPET
jgi:DNA-binding SARP family transcriptional activator